MKLIDDERIEYIAERVYKVPKMTPHRGRTWDKFMNSINGEPIWMWLDTTWGSFFYFSYREREWKIPVVDFVNLKGKKFWVVE